MAGHLPCPCRRHAARSTTQCQYQTRPISAALGPGREGDGSQQRAGARGWHCICGRARSLPHATERSSSEMKKEVRLLAARRAAPITSLCPPPAPAKVLMFIENHAHMSRRVEQLAARRAARGPLGAPGSARWLGLPPRRRRRRRRHPAGLPCRCCRRRRRPGLPGPSRSQRRRPGFGRRPAAGAGRRRRGRRRRRPVPVRRLGWRAGG